MYSDLEEIIHQLKSCTSLLDNIPNKLFKSVSRCFTNHIINSSLQTGIFCFSQMCCNHTATQQEQLRVIGNDYRGISNLSFLKIF